ncbi:MAG: hypothetical protein ACRCXN_06340 [Bacteroidales bacterium]
MSRIFLVKLSDIIQIYPDLREFKKYFKEKLNGRNRYPEITYV